MAWEKRNKRAYYYRKQRVGNQVKSIYVGTEDAAGLVVDRELQRRKDAQAERARFEVAKAEIQDRMKEVNAVTQQLELWIRAALLDAGLHRNVNAQWRQRRVIKR